MVNNITKNDNQENLRDNIVLNTNEITWSEKIYQDKSKEKILEKRKEILKEYESLEITDM